jgi:endonuclease-3
MEPEKAVRISKRIIESFPREHEENDPFRVLVSTVISQRNRDEVTDRVSAVLFDVFPTIDSLISLKPEALYSVLHSAGMYRQKSERIIAIARIIHANGGKVPNTLETLLKLPGVGRKTANIVLYVCFGIPAMAVDTHVHRISNRIGFVRTVTPEKTESGLIELLPENLWGPLNGSMVEMGRIVCKPSKPRCCICPVNTLCEWPEKTTNGGLP